MAENKQTEKTSVKEDKETPKVAPTPVKKEVVLNTAEIEKAQEEREAKEALKEFAKEEALTAQPAKVSASKNTSGKFVQKLKKRKIRRQVQRGQAYIKATYNNTMITLCDLHGNVLAWSSSGYLGFKGAKKATTYAASQVVNDVAEKVQKYGLKDLDIFVKGVGSGRESAIRTLAQKGFNLNMIKDRTPIPHNGCRGRKPRRV